MIKLILLDIDGVLTDGKLTIDSEGKEYKTIDFRDIDAVFELKRLGYKIGLITGEASPITLYFKDRFKPDFFYNGCKDKVAALNNILEKTGYSKKEVCFVGDSKHDIPVMKEVGLSACPANATEDVQGIAKCKLKYSGGGGCILELMEYLNKETT